MTTRMVQTGGRLGGVGKWARRTLAVGLATGAGILGAAACRAADPGPLAADAPVAAILDALRDRGNTLRDFSADVTLTSLDTGTQVPTAQTGHVWFQSDASTGGRIRVNFDTDKIGDRVTKVQHQYILGGQDLLNGQNLVEIDYEKKRITTQQVVKPGVKMNLMKLGEGPFPLPIGQDPKDVLEQFTATTLAAAKDDPAGTVHLSLTPKAGTAMARKASVIEVFVDRATDMPIRIVTIDQSGEELKTTQLAKVQINQGLDANAFKIPDVPKDFDKIDKAYDQ